MKKALSIILLAVLAVTLLAGCGNPVYDDFENFLNVEMADVNAIYEEIKAEAATWSEMEDIADLSASITNVLLPLCDESLAKLAEINPATEEVQALKAKYVAVIEAYKEGFTLTEAAVAANSVEQMEEGSAKITEGITLLDEYNAALEALAEEVGAEISY